VAGLCGIVIVICLHPRKREVRGRHRPEPMTTTAAPNVPAAEIRSSPTGYASPLSANVTCYGTRSARQPP
jgi:hypothetical protein